MEIKIYPKIDWWTGIYTDCSFNDVLSHLRLSDSISADEFLANAFVRDAGYETRTVLNFDGIEFEFSGEPWLETADPLTCFDRKFKKIRCNMSGHGLDTYRVFFMDDFTRDISADDYLRSSEFRPDFLHCTRIDFAFDFIDCCESLLDDMIRYCLDYQTSYNRICCAGLNAGLRWSYRMGDQKTLYLGATTSQQLLRCYDKKLQYTNPVTGAIKDNPYGVPDSWIRIELQLRKDRADSFCYGDGDFSSILKYIWEFYAFRDTSLSVDHKAPVIMDFWKNAIDLDDIPRFIQNLHCNPRDGILERVEKNVLRNKKAITLFMLAFGPKYLVKLMNQWLFDITHPQSDVQSRQGIALATALNLCNFQENFTNFNFDSGFIQINN